MAGVEIAIEHELSRDEAASRLERLVAAKDAEDPLLRGLDFTRQDGLFSFSGRVKGFMVSGEMAVLDEGIRITVNLPWAARPFSEPVNKYIREYFEAKLA